MLEGYPELKKLLWPLRMVWHSILWLRNNPRRTNRLLFGYDAKRFLRESGAYVADRKESLLAWLTMQSHVLEKGLTMPNRRLGFGRLVVLDLIRRVNEYVLLYGDTDERLRNAVSVVREYFEVHQVAGFEMESEASYWIQVKQFADKFKYILPSRQLHFTVESFLSEIGASFPSFSASRHTVRNYADRELPIDRLRQAMKLAMRAPSACNRQHCRVYCLKDRSQFSRILDLQAGNRGFGHLANKVLVVTADLRDCLLNVERSDAFINGGMFLMNLCYALHYNRVGHCILNWSKNPQTDQEAHAILGIPANEVIIALLTCGELPDEFDVASSPRRGVQDVFKVID